MIKINNVIFGMILYFISAFLYSYGIKNTCSRKGAFLLLNGTEIKCSVENG